MIPGSKWSITLVTFFTAINTIELCTICYLFAFDLHGIKFLKIWETIADVSYFFAIIIEFWTAIPLETVK